MTPQDTVSRSLDQTILRQSITDSKTSLSGKADDGVLSLDKKSGQNYADQIEKDEERYKSSRIKLEKFVYRIR